MPRQFCLNFGEKSKSRHGSRRPLSVAGCSGRRGTADMRRRDTERRGEFLITIKADVVDAHFAGLNTIHYLLKVLVFDLQSITDQ